MSSPRPSVETSSSEPLVRPRVRDTGGPLKIIPRRTITRGDEWTGTRRMQVPILRTLTLPLFSIITLNLLLNLILILTLFLNLPFTLNLILILILTLNLTPTLLTSIIAWRRSRRRPATLLPLLECPPTLRAFCRTCARQWPSARKSIMRNTWQRSCIMYSGRSSPVVVSCTFVVGVCLCVV